MIATIRGGSWGSVGCGCSRNGWIGGWRDRDEPFGNLVYNFGTLADVEDGVED